MIPLTSITVTVVGWMERYTVQTCQQKAGIRVHLYIDWIADHNFADVRRKIDYKKKPKAQGDEWLSANPMIDP